MRSAVVAALAYLVLYRVLRATLTRDHTRGIESYKAGRFEEAIQHFEASRQFFCRHRRLDAWRSFIFGVASQNPYRVIALGNMAYCYGQLGDANRAIELYEQVLRESPDNTLAKASLQLLRAVPSTGSKDHQGTVEQATLPPGLPAPPDP